MEINDLNTLSRQELREPRARIRLLTLGRLTLVAPATGAGATDE